MEGGEALWSDPAFLAVAVPAVIFAGVSKGGFGSGAAFAATPLLTLATDPATALGVMLPLLMLMDLAVLRPYWGRWSRGEAQLLILGALPGIAAAALVWRVAPAALFQLLIGLMALGFVAWQARGALATIPPARAAPGRGLGLSMGAVAGFTSFIGHAGGPPVAVYLLARGHPKTVYQATTVLVFWAVNLTKAAVFAALGLFTAQTLAAGLALVPAALLGAAIGVRAHHLVPERAFFAITYALLVGAGGKLVWDALA